MRPAGCGEGARTGTSASLGVVAARKCPVSAPPVYPLRSLPSLLAPRTSHSQLPRPPAPGLDGAAGDACAGGPPRWQAGGLCAQPGTPALHSGTWAVLDEPCLPGAACSPPWYYGRCSITLVPPYTALPADCLANSGPEGHCHCAPRVCTKGEQCIWEGGVASPKPTRAPPCISG